MEELMRGVISNGSEGWEAVLGRCENYTEPANEFNDENIFVLGSTHAEVAGVEVKTNPCRQLAGHRSERSSGSSP